MTLHLDVSELDALARDLGRAPEYKQKEARAVAQRTGRAVKSKAVAEVARDTGGTAAQGIRMKTWSDRGSVHVDVYTTRDERGVNVGFLLEYGTSETPPRPFLAIQASWAQSQFVNDLADIADPFRRFPAPELGDD